MRLFTRRNIAIESLTANRLEIARYCNFAYSALGSVRMGMFGSAFLNRAPNPGPGGPETPEWITAARSLCRARERGQIRCGG